MNIRQELYIRIESIYERLRVQDEMKLSENEMDNISLLTIKNSKYNNWKNVEEVFRKYNDGKNELCLLKTIENALESTLILLDVTGCAVSFSSCLPSFFSKVCGFGKTRMYEQVAHQLSSIEHYLNECEERNSLPGRFFSMLRN